MNFLIAIAPTTSKAFDQALHQEAGMVQLRLWERGPGGSPGPELELPAIS
jgi:hypothetical protein